MASLALDPSLPLQAAVFKALSTHPAMIAAYQALAKNPADVPRVYDTVPLGQAGQVNTALFPYHTIGEDQIVPDTPGLVDEAYVKVEAWSRTTDYGEVKALGGAARLALAAYLEVAGFRTITWRFHTSMPPRKEPDGLTRRFTLTVAYLLIPATARLP